MQGIEQTTYYSVLAKFRDTLGEQEARKLAYEAARGARQNLLERLKQSTGKGSASSAEGV